MARCDVRGGDVPTDRRFTGQRRDGAVGLYDYNARWCDPAIGRFLQPDTIVPEPGNPQDLNRYAYVRNNPVRYTDPSGHCPWCIAVGIGALIGAGVTYGTQVAANISENGLNVQAFTDVNWKRVGAGAVAGAVGAATFGTGTAVLGTGLIATAASGALSGTVAGQTERVVENILSGEDVLTGLGDPADMAVDALVGAVSAGAGRGIQRLVSGARSGARLLDAGSWQEAEAAVGARLGVAKNTHKMFVEGMSKPRIPDFITENGIYEVKWYSRTKLTWTAQLQDEAMLARELGKPFYIVVRQGTRVSATVFERAQRTGGDVLRWLR